MGSVETKLRIENETDTNIVNIHVFGFDKSNWLLPFRPDAKFEGSQIDVNDSKEENLKYKINAPTCFFSMTLIFDDGTKDSFRINQKHALSGPSNFSHFHKTNIMRYERAYRNKLVIIVCNSEEQKSNKRAKKINERGFRYSENGCYQLALKTYQNAVVHALDPVVRRNIAKNQIITQSSYAKHLLSSIWADNQEKTMTELHDNLVESKVTLQKSIAHDKSPLTTYKLKAIDNFIEGNDRISDAVQVIKDSDDFSAKTALPDLHDVKSQLKKAVDKHSEAKAVYEEGLMEDKRFDEGIAYLQKSKESLIEMLKEIEELILSKSLNEGK